jgi:hypothetical protein
VERYLPDLLPLPQQQVGCKIVVCIRQFDFVNRNDFRYRRRTARKCGNTSWVETLSYFIAIYIYSPFNPTHLMVSSHPHIHCSQKEKRFFVSSHQHLAKRSRAQCAMAMQRKAMLKPKVAPLFTTHVRETQPSASINATAPRVSPLPKHDSNIQCAKALELLNDALLGPFHRLERDDGAKC